MLFLAKQKRAGLYQRRAFLFFKFKFFSNSFYGSINKNMRKRKRLGFPEYIFGFSLLTVLGSFVVFYLVDLRNFLDLRDLLFSVKRDYFFFTYQPFFFQHWGRNSGFAEMLQWFFLAGSVITMAFAAGKISSFNKKLFLFSGIMSIAFALMLLEDAGDIRHVLMSYVQALFDEPDQGIFGTLTEFLYFSVLAFIPLYALFKYWKSLKGFVKTKFYFLIGFAFYGLAASLSFIGTAFEGLLERNIYTMAGEKLYHLSLSLGDAGLLERWESTSYPIGFFLMDSLVEENIEIIATAAIFAASVSFLIYLSRDFSFSEKELK